MVFLTPPSENKVLVQGIGQVYVKQVVARFPMTLLMALS
jgi:hypothetical protein